MILIKAEKAWKGGRKIGAVALYEKVQDQALANERLAELHIEEGAHVEAEYRIEQAIGLYAEWKAGAKVRQLKSRLTRLRDSR